MALTQQELFNLQRFAPITRPTSPYSNSNNPPQQVRTFLPATRSSNPYASLMALTPQQRIAGSSGGFDPSIYKKLPGLLTTPATGTVGESGGGNDNIFVGGGGGGNLGVGPGQGVSSDAQRAALSLISLADKYPAILPGGIFAKVLGLLGGLTADSQTSKMAEAQKAIEAIDKQNAAALESGSSRTFDPYGGTKGVMSVSDANGNVRAFDPYAGDSAKDADKSKALADSGLSTASNFVGPMPKSDTYTGDFVGPMPKSDAYTGDFAGFFKGRDFGGPVPKSDTFTSDFVGPMPKSDTYTGDFGGPVPKSDTYTGDFVGPMPQNNTFSGGLLGDFAERQDEADAAVIASDNAARENAAITAALANTTGIDLSAPSFASTTFQGSAYSPAVAAAADVAAADKAAADKAVADKAAADKAAADVAAADKAAADKAAADKAVAEEAAADVAAADVAAEVDGFDLGQFLAKGGMVNMKPQMNNPPGPDDGYAALQNGEYVIRKSAVKKYGANIFEQINAGQIPARRLKSLLE